MSPAPSTGAVDATEFRRWMGRWATGVSVVTAHEGGHDHGMTVNAFLSVSLAPPTVLVALTHDADTTPVVERSGAFAVNLLAADQRALSERFAALTGPEEKFRGLALRRGTTGAALLSDTLGALEVRVRQAFDVADHRLFLAEALEVHPGREAAPLLFFRSRYAEDPAAARVTLDGAPPALKR